MFDSATVDSASDFDSLFASANAEAKADSLLPHYQNDCLWIVDRAQSSPDYIPGIVTFVLSTIQQAFFHVPDIMEDIAKQGLHSRYMWGWKPDGYRYAVANKVQLWESAKRFERGAISLDELILDYLAVPGLGIVKASFLAQLTVGEGACLDTHNLRSLGMRLDAFKTPKTLSLAALRKRIALYNETWRRAGDSAYWWNQWCEGVGGRTHNARGYAVNGTFPGGGAQVSALHRISITAGVR